MSEVNTVGAETKQDLQVNIETLRADMERMVEDYKNATKRVSALAGAIEYAGAVIDRAMAQAKPVTPACEDCEGGCEGCEGDQRPVAES
jgi:hypothetical protein